MTCRRLPFAALTFALLLASGCSRTDNEPGPGGVTVGEAKALDEAAAKLEARDKAAETSPDVDTAEEQE